MAALDVDGAVQNVKTMLAGLSAWQTICGVSGSAAAAERIHEGGVFEDEAETQAPMISLDVTDLPSDWLASAFQGNLGVEIRCEIPIPTDSQTNYASEWRYAWQKCSAILAGINGGVGQSGGLMVESLQLRTPPGKIDTDENQGRCEWGFIIALTVTLR